MTIKYYSYFISTLLWNIYNGTDIHSIMVKYEEESQSAANDYLPSVYIPLW